MNKNYYKILRRVIIMATLSVITIFYPFYYSKAESLDLFSSDSAENKNSPKNIPNTDANLNAQKNEKNTVVNCESLPTSSKIARVIDGDTYELETKQRIRALYINTPEKYEDIGTYIANLIRNVFTKESVKIEYDYPCVDHYGRLLGNILWNDESISEYIIRQGWGHVYIIPPAKPSVYDKLINLQANAKKENKGIWSNKRYKNNLHITSMHITPSYNKNGDSKEEYIRVANISLEDLSLDGYSLKNKAGNVFIFPKMIIPKGYTFQVITGKGSMQGNQNVPYKLYWDRDSDNNWNDSGDIARIYDKAGNLVDEMAVASR